MQQHLQEIYVVFFGGYNPIGCGYHSNVVDIYNTKDYTTNSVINILVIAIVVPIVVVGVTGVFLIFYFCWFRRYLANKRRVNSK